MNFLTAYVELKVDDKTVKVKLADIKKAFMGVASDTEKRWSKMDLAFGRNLGSMLRRVIGWAAAITAVIKSVKGFAAFEQQLLDVSTLLDDKFMPLLPKYGEAVKELAMDFGHSTDQLNKALYDIISATIPPAQALEVLTVASRAAVAGITEVGASAYAIVGIMNAYGQSVYSAAQVSDILFVTVKKGLTTFRELAPAIGRVTTIASSAGISLEEVGAAMATITRGGINTNEAVTVLRMAILSLQGTAEISAESAKKYGITLSAQSLKAKGLKGSIEELSKLSPDALKDIIREVRARLAITKLIQDQEGFLTDLNLAYESAGYTQKAFDKQSQGLMFQLNRMKQAIKVVAIEIASSLAPALKDIADKFVQFIKDHRNEIWKWANLFSANIAYVKDIIYEFVRFMINDWHNGSRAALEGITDLFVRFGKSIIAVLKHAAVAAADAFIGAFGEKLGKWLIETGKPEGALGKLSMAVPSIGATRLGMMEAGVGLVEKARKPATEKDTLMKDLEEIWQGTSNIVNKYGIDIEEAVKNHNQRVLDIEKQYQQRIIYQRQIAEDQALIDQLKAEGKFDEVEGKVKDTRRTIIQHMAHVGDYSIGLLSAVGNATSKMLGRIKTSIEGFDINASFNNMIDSTGRAFDRMQQFADNWMKTGEERWIDFAEAIKSPMESAFEDLIFKGQKFGDFMLRLGEAIVQEFIKIQFIQPMVGMLSAGIGGLYTPAGQAHSGGDVGNMANNRLISPFAVAAAPRYHGLKPGEQAIVAEKGETVSKGPIGGDTYNVSLYAIDTQTGLQFLAKHRRDIATMARASAKENHTSRRSGG